MALRNLPTGTVLPYAGSAAPAGYLLCDGTAISRTTYAELYRVLGTAFGTGDGSTTFNVPDLRDRLPLGKGTNNALGEQGTSAAASGALTSGTSADTVNAVTAGGVTAVTTSAHTHTVTLPRSVVNYIIRT